MNQAHTSTLEKTYYFADWQFNPKDGQLNSKHKKVRLQPRLAELLTLLLSNQGELLSRSALVEMIWQDKFVNEDALSRCIAELRAALGDKASTPKYIETVPKKGYRFIHAVTVQSNNTSQSIKTRPFNKLVFISLLLLLIVWFTYEFMVSNEDLTQPIKSAINSAKRVTTDSALEYQPELSNAGDLVAFSVTKKQNLVIKVVDKLGKSLFEISDPELHLVSPAFSPDDNKLLVAGLSDISCTVFIYHLPSLKREELTRCMSPDPSGIFDWSANGQYFAYVNRDTASQNNQQVAAIWRYDLSSHQEQQLSFPVNQNSYDTRPRFSPDEQYIAFTRGNGSIRNLFVKKLVETNTTGVATDVTKQAAYITSFDWFKDSQQLIFDSNVLGDRNLWLVDRHSHQARLLGARDAKYASLNRQNTHLAFQEVRYNANIWQLDLTADKAAEPLIQSIKYNNFPTFSPDGKQIAFVSNRKGKAGIWLYNIASGRQSQLLAMQDADLVQPNWSADGSQLLVSSRSASGYGCYQINLATTHYQPIHGIAEQHHACQYSSQGDIYAISKQADEKHSVIKIDKKGQVTQVTDFSVERLQLTQNNKIIYSLPNNNGLFLMDIDGQNKRLLIKDFAQQLDAHWTVQGDYLYYPKLEPNKGIWRRHLNTAEEQKVTDILPFAIGLTLAVSPDHTYLIFSQTDSRQADVYLADITANK